VTRYFVTGASGLLGLNLCLHLAKKHEVIGVIHQDELQGVPYQVIIEDLSNGSAPQRLIERIKPDVVVHTAAMAIVDECEKQPERAMLVNGVLPGIIAAICKRRSIPMVHISTDAVFDGEKGNYTEEDRPNPLSIYANSKLEGENAVKKENPDAIIARVNFFGWSLRGDRSLAESFYANLSVGKLMKGFTDVHFCALFVMNLVDILLKMIKEELHGMYHAVSSESLSKYDFGIAIARKFGFDEKLIEPTRVADSGLVAKRSPNLTLNVGKLTSALKEELPGQAESLNGFWQQKQINYPEMLHGFMKG
jgi:dTDP-4-dehydrorhamnose reductase